MPDPMMMMAMKGMKGKGKGKGKGPTLNDFPPETKVWVGNLPASATFKELQAHFNQAGKTKWAECFKGVGGVAYTNAQEAQNAIAMLNGSQLGGSVIQVDVWTQKEKKDGAKGGPVKRRA